MLKLILMIAITVLLVGHTFRTQATPVDVDGDGLVGPHELLDLEQHWKGPALTVDATQPWRIHGANIHYGTGNVGIGTATPQTKLHVNGTAWFQGDNTPLPPDAGKGIGIGFAGEQGYLFGFDYTNYVPKNLVLQNPGGNVGIGTVFPNGGRLHVDGANATAVYATAIGGAGVKAFSSSNSGVYGNSTSGYGVDGRSNSSIGVYGQSSAPVSAGAYGTSPFIGVEGVASGDDPNRQAVRGENGGSATGYAGLFAGNTWVVGTLTKNGGSFKIDHPLDPANKYLSHSFVESPDMMNIYNGNVVLDDSGEAEVELPDWFMELNKDFRYQLTPIGGPGPNLYIAQKITEDRFRIGGGSAGLEVSWQVTGVRQDAWANAHRIVVEEDKPDQKKGEYLTPEVFGQPKEKGIHYRPEVAPPSEVISKNE